ncbi:fluoride efflux transporter CrcB [Kushneria aurantia]|uniref:Fluoride-specific ion channel FluC n=1 Tax=Kushneria aurantia TaxID=504092 RepID=A0ABV6G7K3_9GAMM|nr:fluoride efflux transporter CrcB [Kushneria aurantia]
MWLSLLAVGLGAALGANLRWGLSLALNALFPLLPPGTLVANLLGAWLIGIAFALFGFLPALSPYWKLFVITGFLGALTTFSTFSLEIVGQLEAGRWLAALAGIAAHLLGSLAFTALGMATVMLIRSRF